MYNIIYTSDENEQFYMYNNIINQNIKKNIQDNVCIICWSKNENNDQLYYTKDFKKYIVSCNCNVLMHDNCLNQWIQQTHSCPICRKQISNNANKNTNVIPYYIRYHYTLRLVRITTLISIFNFCCFLIFNTYFQYTMLHQLLKDHFL